jgi:hypothetical protein
MGNGGLFLPVALAPLRLAAFVCRHQLSTFFDDCVLRGKKLTVRARERLERESVRERELERERERKIERVRERDREKERVREREREREREKEQEK